MPSSSFFTDGETYATSYTTSGDTPGSTTASQAPSSFFPNGGDYAALQDGPTLLSQMQAYLASTQASATSASTSASNAAASASAAAASASTAAAGVSAFAGTATPLVAGTAAVGTSTRWAHEDHRHPVDTATPDARIANAAGTATPAQAGTAAVGTSTRWAHEDHVHPTDTTRAAKASPSFTGTVTSAGPVNINDTTAASAYNAAALTIAGGLGVADKLYVGTGTSGGVLNLNGATGANTGANILFRYNGTGVFGFGRSAGVLGGTADDFVITAPERQDGSASINISRGSNPDGVAAHGVGGVVTFMNGLGGGTPAGGSTSARILFGNSVGSFGIYWGSGVPTVSAAAGSLYLRTDGGAGTSLYVNQAGTWTAK